MADLAPQLVTLVEIQAPGGTRRFATAQSYAAGFEWEERLLTHARVERATLTGGADGDLGALSIEDSAGDLVPWTDPSSGDDPRGAVCKVYEVPADDRDTATPALILEGTIERVYAEARGDGSRVVQVTAASVSGDAGKTVLPPVITTTTFGVPQAEVPAESLGVPVPVVVGGTREHFRVVPVKHDDTDAQYDWAICYDATDAHILARVNTLYRLADDNKLRIVPPLAYAQRHDLYAGRLVCRFSDARYKQTQLFADAEASEYDTTQTGVARHWLFRDGLKDETIGAELLSSAAVGAWEFNGTGNDSSGNGHHLSALAGSESPLVFTDENGVTNGALHNARLPHVGGRFEAGATTSTFDVGLGTSFRIEAIVSRQSRDVLASLEGAIAAKWGNGSAVGYGLDVYGGVPRFWVQGATAAESIAINGRTRIDLDDNFHTIVASFDRASGLMTLNVDGTQEAAASIAGVGSLSNTNTKLYVATDRAGLHFSGKLGRVCWYSEAAGASFSFVTGQSGQARSALDQSTGYVREGSAVALNVGGASDVVLLAWFKRATNPGSTELLAGKYTGTTGYKLELLTGGTLRATFGDGTTTKVLTSSADLCDGEWHQVFAQVDRDGNVELYVDGTADGSTSASGLGSLSNAANLEVRIVGQIDELMLRIGSGIALTATVIRANYFTARGNPARWARRFIENASYGLGQTADATTFNAAEEELRDRGIYFGGAITEEKSAREMLALFTVYGLDVYRGSGTWKARFGWQATAGSPWAFGWNDGALANVLYAQALERAGLESVPKAVSVKYKRSYDPTRPNAPYLFRTFARTVGSGKGRDVLILEAPLVRVWAVADRLGAYAAQWLAKDRAIKIGATTENRAAVPGDRATLSAPALGLSSATTWIVEKDARVDPGTIEYALRESPADPTAYAPGTEIPDLIPEALPDYRWTNPPAPEQIEILGQAAISIATRVGFRMLMPSGDVADALVVGVRAAWNYYDATTPEEFEQQTVDIAAKAGQTVDWYAIFEPGREVEVAFFTLSIYGQSSGPGLWKDGSTTKRFTVAEDSGTTTAGLYGLEGRVAALEAGSGGGNYVPVLLTDNANLPSEPDLTGGREVFILGQGTVRTRVGATPNAGQFTLGGGTNQAITYGQSPGTAKLVALYVPAA